MKLVKLTSNIVLPVKASVINYKKYKDNEVVRNSLYFNVRHGSRGEGLHQYILTVDSRKFKPKSEDEVKKFEDSNYVLLPVCKEGVHKKDKKGNHLYTLSTDEVEEHRNDCIVLWEIPNKFYTNVKYTISGNAKELASGIIGRHRDNVSFTSPAPILEVYGQCELSWSAEKDGVLYKQTFKYLENNWVIERMTKGDIKDVKESN